MTEPTVEEIEKIIRGHARSMPAATEILALIRDRAQLQGSMTEPTPEDREGLARLIRSAFPLTLERPNGDAEDREASKRAADAILAAGYRLQRPEGEVAGDGDGPILTHYDDPKRVEFVIRDAPTVHELSATDPRVERLLDIDTRALVGVVVHLSPPASAPQWRAIESAPRDGTFIIGGEPEDHRFGYVGLTCWLGGDWDDWGGDPEGPTHWLPLPPPPSEGVK